MLIYGVRGHQSFSVFDINEDRWIVNRQVSVPVRDYQYLIANSENVALQHSLFLISLDHIVYIEYARVMLIVPLPRVA
jgi:hypothetical protein